MDCPESRLPAERYSGAKYWDEYHEIARGKSLDRTTKLKTWLESFRPLLDALDEKTVLDLGCGSGHDAVALSRSGFEVSGCDISGIAMDEARKLAANANQDIDFRQLDIARPLPYRDSQFGAVVCNLTLHMFPPAIADDIVQEVERCLAPGGLFAFHVNATRDIPYRRKLQPPVRELENGMYCFGQGQTMRFFAEEDCRELLKNWKIALLEPVEMLDSKGGIVKCAWRCAAFSRIRK